MLFFVFLHTETNSKRNDMKRSVFLLAIILSTVLGSSAQEKSQITASLTAYPDFRPATVYMANGKKVNVALANIFLKNSSLLYVNSKGTPMEADTKTLLRVDFSDRSYFRVDTLMAYPVDTVGTNGLFCAWVIDLVAYRQTVRNNTNITNLDLSSTNMINYSTLDVSDIEALPLIPIYYFKLGAATESMTTTSMAPERIRLSAISRACSPLSGWEMRRVSMLTPRALA